MKNSDDLDWFALERLYDEGRRLFVRGKHEAAIERFERIYEDTLELGYVAEAVDDYYTLPREQWIARYQVRFQE